MLAPIILPGIFSKTSRVEYFAFLEYTGAGERTYTIRSIISCHWLYTNKILRRDQGDAVNIVAEVTSVQEMHENDKILFSGRYFSVVAVRNVYSSSNKFLYSKCSLADLHNIE